MDPVTQGALGAALAQSAADGRRLGAFTLAGGTAGLAADLDIFISSSTDPLLYLELHRQFTHALVFIPFGAALCALVLHPFLRKTLGWRETYLACLLGYATHGLLDACTSYGTQLFWPFSTLRVSWNWISVVDPLFTLPLVLLLTAGFLRRQRAFAAAGLIWAVGYMVLGVVQHERAADAAAELAAERGHAPSRLAVKPGFANLLVWKSIYERGGRYYVDGIRAGITPGACEGESIAALDISAQLPWLAEDSQQHQDIERFRGFSDDWLALDPEEPFYVVDVRYSALPNRIAALWGLKLSQTAGEHNHASYHVVRSRRTEALDKLFALIAGTGCRPLAVR